jgi:hypothetical protein
MGLNNANYIDGLNPNDPAYNDLIANSASHVRAIKRAMKQTLPGITGAVTVGPAVINTIEARIAALEASSLTTTPMASGRDTLNGAGVLTVSTLSFQPSLIMVMAAKDGSEANSQASMSFGFTDGSNHYCHAHKVIYTGTGSMTVGNSTYTDRVAQVDAYGSSATIVYTSFTATGFTLTQSGSTPVSTITWTAWK